MDLKEKLKILAQLESSGGKNRVHEQQKSGIHAGTRAISSYGLMPNTVAEFVKRNKKFQSTPSGSAVLSVLDKPEEINKVTEDPKHDDAIMQALLEEQKQRIQKNVPETEDTELLNVFAHRRGVSAAIKAAKDGSYKDDPYVQAYTKEKAKRFPKLNDFIGPPPPKPEVE